MINQSRITIAIIWFLALLLPSIGLTRTEVFFNNDPQASYRDPHRGHLRAGHNFEEIILREIRQARQSIEVAVQEFRIRSIAEELVKKHNQGLHVRIIIEKSYNNLSPENSSGGRDDFDPDVLSRPDNAMHILRESNISVSDNTSDGSRGSGLMHHKFIVIDGRTTIVTSANFTIRDFHGDPRSSETIGNANALLVFEDPQVSRIFLEEFNIMYGAEGIRSIAERNPAFALNKPFRGAQKTSLPDGGWVKVQFPPTSTARPRNENTAGLIERFFQRAASSIHAALFVFSDQGISDKLKYLKQQRGTEISLLVDRMFAFRFYSKAMDMLGLKLLSPHCRYQAGVNPWSQPAERVGTPQLASSDKLHHKFAVIDERTVVFGSKNWTNAGTHQNDEVLMVIEHLEVAREFMREVNRLHENAAWGPLPWVHERIAEAEARCAGRVASF